MYYLCNSSLVLFCFISLLHHPHGASNQECNALQINQTSSTLTLAQTDRLGERELSLNNLESVVRPLKVEVKVKINEKMCQDCSFSSKICGFDATFHLGVKCCQLHPPTGQFHAKWDYISKAVDQNFSLSHYLSFNEMAPLSNNLPPDSLSSNFGQVMIDRIYFYSSAFCKFVGTIPAYGPLQNTQTSGNLQTALEVTQECLKCIDSGGAWGYNQRSGRLDCYRINEPHKNKGLSTRSKAGIGIAFGLVVILLLAGLFCLMRRLRKISDNPREENIKALIPLKHYSYAQVKKITKSFAEVLGKGGFGIVYRGTLSDGRSVAVKILKDSKGNGEDFINEVSSISKTSHVNIVSMLGFFSEGSKRAILYEFVENGSLDKFISRNNSMNKDRMALYGIALGVARGLEYLHYGCKTRIVHFDIKPSNVLLDKNLCPKVSDFGLAKLCGEKESIMSLVEMRSTIGYIAPEMISRVYGSVSYKSDVYSYGMLVLEMIGARNKTSTEHSTSNASSMYFPEWIYKDLERRDNGRLIESGISSEEVEITKKMTLVGLWCIQSSPSDRPPMNRVVEMMEGSVDALEVPPSPALPMVPASFQESSMLSEDISVYLE